MFGSIFAIALIVSTMLVVIDRIAKGLLMQCPHCGRDRFRRGTCPHCGALD